MLLYYNSIKTEQHIA